MMVILLSMVLRVVQTVKGRTRTMCMMMTVISQMERKWGINETRQQYQTK